MAQGGPEAAEAFAAVMERRKAALCFHSKRPPPIWSEGKALHSSVFVPTSGKREGQCSLVAVCAGSSNKLLFILKEVSGRHFLVDSVVQRNITPVSEADILCQSDG
ncbi:hypothetical protein CHARACLAT_029006 [Characodon lateralis]|uniref:Uncharacterized protein n=1 Tax=Characodon lateralis TaxID=208331 RepID=A0ABU7EY92_9TELE|nr:hypothetical protein [Characodon lateralis]